MLGRFHEISIETPDIRASVEFYERLGFSQATTTDTWTHPYGVLTDGRVFIGLHQRALPALSLTFVRPQIARHAADFAARSIELEIFRAGEETFNEIAFRAPGNLRVCVLEARTYSPVARRATEPSLCGYFTELSIPATDLAAAQSFWEPLGFVATEDCAVPYRRLVLTSDHLNLAFHDPSSFARPLLVFSDSGMPQRFAKLRALDVPLERATALPKGLNCATNGLLFAPEGTALLLRAEDAAQEAADA